MPERLRADPAARLGGGLASGDADALRRRVERVARRADGTEFPVEVSITPIEGDGGPLYTAFLRDITERHEAEAALRGIRDDLQKRVEARTAELKEANERLVDWVEELQQRAQDMRLLAETGDHLQACHTVQEAYAVLEQYGGSLFPDEPGALCMLDEGRNVVECVAAWGTPPHRGGGLHAGRLLGPAPRPAARRGGPGVAGSSAGTWGRRRPPPTCASP